MEWVETTGRTVDEAKSAALDQLGVGEDDAEFEVMDEPRSGLFGRVRGEARVRARVRPSHPRPKTERKRRDTRANGEQSTPAPKTPARAAGAAAHDPADAPRGEERRGRCRRAER